MSIPYVVVVKRFIPRFLILVAGLGLSGCQGTSVYKAYRGAERPTDQVALVEIPKPMELLKLDGASMLPQRLMNFSGGVKLHVLPGPHKLLVRRAVLYDLDSEDHELHYGQSVLLSFNAEAGHRYKLVLGESTYTTDEPERIQITIRDIHD